jgi:hypothetical protein
LSVFGVTALAQIPYSPWLKLTFVALMLLNLLSVWMRARTTGRIAAFCLVAIGGLAIVSCALWPVIARPAAWTGVVLTMAGSFLSAAQTDRKAVPFFLRREPLTN